MLTEFEVRRQLDLIQKSDAPPGAKARKLLRLGKSLRTQAQELVEAQARAERSQNVNANRQLERMVATARALREEARSAALAILRSRPQYRFNA